jgi:hypothetical protein
MPANFEVFLSIPLPLLFIKPYWFNIFDIMEVVKIRTALLHFEEIIGRVVKKPGRVRPDPPNPWPRPDPPNP